MKELVNEVGKKANKPRKIYGNWTREAWKI